MRLLVATGVVIVGALAVIAGTLVDDGGDADRKAAGPEPPGADVARPGAHPGPAGAGAESRAARPDAAAERGGGGLPGAAHPGAGAPAGDGAARAGPPDVGPVRAPSASAEPSRAPRPGASRAAGGATGTRPDGGSRSGEIRGALDNARRAGGKDDRERDSRDDDGDFILVAHFMATGGAILQGRVLDADTGRPVAGTGVEARHAGRYMKGSTDGNGAFRMLGMLPGSRVVVWVGGKRDAFVPERIDVAIPGEGQVADTGVVRLLRGDEMAPRLDGWTGLFVTRRNHRVVVSAVSPWLPADRAGVGVGDAVLSIDGRDVTGFGPRAATFLLRGPAGGTAAIVVEDRTGTRHKLTLERVQR